MTGRRRCGALEALWCFLGLGYKSSLDVCSSILITASYRWPGEGKGCLMQHRHELTKEQNHASRDRNVSRRPCLARYVNPGFVRKNGRVRTWHVACRALLDRDRGMCSYRQIGSHIASSARAASCCPISTGSRKPLSALTLLRLAGLRCSEERGKA